MINSAMPIALPRHRASIEVARRGDGFRKFAAFGGLG
jgi:hypothetical protein